MSLESTKMKSLSSVGLGLSVVFGCLFLALLAEIYYLLWWKRRVTGREVEDEYYSNSAREFLYIFCCQTKKRPYSWNPENPSSSTTGENKDSPLKLIVGPPRFLYTIEEETKEELDLESDDGKCKRLSDLMNNGDNTPYLTPLSSPAFFTPPLTPSSHSSCYNPLYESCNDVEFNKIKASPPPKFKFLRDAEEKLQKKNTIEDEERGSSSKSEEDESFITIIV